MFNEKQTESIEFEKGAAMVLAGPGTGKTTIITHRIKRLIEKDIAQPENILVVTFTKAAAIEMQERFEKLSNNAVDCEKVTFGTFHSIFYRILKQSDGSFMDSIILSDSKRQQIIREIVLRIKVDTLDLQEFIRVVAGEISKVKGNGLDGGNFASGICEKETFHKVYHEYEKALVAEKLIDFDDMIIKCKRLFEENETALKYWQNKFKYILVDEFQDINKLQYENIKLLAGDEKNVFVVGDDDQSIYSFRGSENEIMFAFAKDFEDAKIINLNINYRSSEQILEVAKNLIINSPKRYEKRFFSCRGSGKSVDVREFETNIEQYRYISAKIKEYTDSGIMPSEIAVLVRNNSSISLIKNWLTNQNIAFNNNGKFNAYNHQIVRDIVSYIRAAQSDLTKPIIENMYLAEIINKPYRYISRQFITEEGMSLEKLKNRYGDVKEILQNIKNLEFHMNMIKNLEPYPAINYIRYGADYEKYMKEYAAEKGMGYEELTRVYDAVWQESINFKTCNEWLDFVEKQMVSQKPDYNSDGVNIITMHSAKGLEYKVVFVPDVNQGIIPEARAVREGNIDEERRIFYVALTRAVDYLHVYWAGNVMGRKCRKSQFVNEMCSCLHF